MSDRRMQLPEAIESVLLNFIFEDVLRAASRLSQEERADLLEWCRQFPVESITKDQTLRISIVRVLVCLMPTSFTLIQEWLLNPRLYEIHFTLFCYLDWAASWPAFEGFKSQTLHLIEAFLLEVRRNSGLAAWMAGDLLGDHWPPEESVPVLINVLGKAKYVAGRKAALSGIEMLCSDRGKYAPPDVGLLVTALRSSSRKDRSALLKKEARLLARELTFAPAPG